MTSEKKKIFVGSRKSQLALIQTHYVIKLLEDKFPNYEFEVITMSTTGDKILDTALSKIGEKSLFTKELEKALYDKSVSFVVHSLKDLPTTLPENMCIGAILKRDDPHDAVVMHAKHPNMKLDDLPQGSVIGTSSLRRSSQLKRRFPHLVFESVRGNLNTRLHKLDGADNYAAIILAAAGLKRMGWHDRISHILNPDECMYAISQGALAVECRSDDEEILKILQTLTHHETLMCCIAERAFLKKLEGGCSCPVACNTIITDSNLYMKGGIYSIDGTEVCEDSLDVNLPDPDEPKAKKRTSSEPRQYVGVIAANIPDDSMRKAQELGTNLAVNMLEAGGDAILKEAKRATEIEIRKRKEEWERTKLTTPQEPTMSKQIPSVVELLKKDISNVEKETKVVACSSK